MLSLVLPAPAKINLFLHVTGRRDDGYHLLESVFVPISLADTVQLTLRADGDIRLLNAPAGLSARNDLACRAARALQAATRTPLGVDIELVKCIPQGAGLGGGSSDAASTLLGLNRLWNLALPRSELQNMGETIGADVPFFVFGKPALARGVGERLQAVTLPVLQVVVASPGVAVATGPVFTHPALTRNTPPLSTPVFNLNFGRNDLQPIAVGLAPEIERLSTAFKAAGAQPRMTGSGSCVFALAHRVGQAYRLRAALERAGWRAWVTRTLRQHPLYGLADDVTI
ncbi:MAG: 4-(cytidine 5'-diphospho)-2-C-methyl-D-erythritol kinase [Rhizobacter sp.]|nr:4-(cytidine 5'-diphospho)-2-C-methyl-D-erythritol kinase [Burkholderiales bacterium]